MSSADSFWRTGCADRVVGAGLAFLRAHSQWFPDVTEMWVILGSMFMFRLIVYLYDLKHRTAPFSLGTRHLIFLSAAKCLFPTVSSRGLQDILLDLLQ